MHRLLCLALCLLAGCSPVVADPPAKSDPVAPYDPNPSHLWNRLHAALLTHSDRNGQTIGRDALDPAVFPTTKRLLEGPTHFAAVKLLDEFLADGHCGGPTCSQVRTVASGRSGETNAFRWRSRSSAVGPTRSKRRRKTPTIAPNRRSGCAPRATRGGGIRGVNSYKQTGAVRQTPMLGLFPGSIADVRARSAEWKIGLKDWAELRRKLAGW